MSEDYSEAKREMNRIERIAREIRSCIYSGSREYIEQKRDHAKELRNVSDTGQSRVEITSRGDREEKENGNHDYVHG